MKITTIAATLVVLTALMGVTNAQPTGTRDDSFFKLDLRPADGPLLFLKCEDHTVRRDVQSWSGDDLRRCGIPSLWQETNDVIGLQSTMYTASGRANPADLPLLA